MACRWAARSGRTVSNGCNQSGGNEWTYTSDGSQSLASRVFLSNCIDLPAEFFDLDLNRAQFVPEMIK
jgi:hypothetical protein